MAFFTSYIIAAARIKFLDYECMSTEHLLNKSKDITRLSFYLVMDNSNFNYHVHFNASFFDRILDKREVQGSAAR